MPIKSEFKYATQGNSVPYPPTWEPGRTNAGYVDLRDAPSLVSQLHEASHSRALRRLLEAIATSADWMSFGCDLGDHREERHEAIIRVAGGYIQFSTRQLPVERSYYEAVGEKLFHALEAGATPNDSWEVRFEIAPVQYEPGPLSVQIASLWVWFFAAAPTLRNAKAGREIMIDLIRKALLGDAEENKRR